jgi:hypothetical protein
LRGEIIIIKRKENFILFLSLIIASVVIYFVQEIIFHRTEETLYLILQDLAFLPVEVALVTFVLDKLLNRMEQQQKVKKINVIISTFFTEAGQSIMIAMSAFNHHSTDIYNIIEKYERKEINSNYSKKLIKSLEYNMYADPEGLDKIAVILADKKSFMIGLLENSNLMEHDSFTDMLWAVFHVADELQNRENLKSLSENDVNHLSADLLRAYSALVQEWIGYMFYLNDEYPYLYKTAKNKMNESHCL